MVKTANVYQSKIDVVKFDGTNNFDIKRCDVMDALNAQNLEDSLKLQKKPEDAQEKDWKKMNWMSVASSDLVSHKI